jgi:hypothetical protein
VGVSVRLGVVVVSLIAGASAVQPAVQAAPTPTPGHAAPLPTALAYQAADCPARLERLTSAGIVWESDPGLEQLARRMADDRGLFSPMPGIGEIDPALSGLTIRLARKLACADAAAPGADWVAGAAWPERGYVVVRAGESVGAVRPVRRVLRHELAHVALHRATNGRAPRWLDEGYAQLASGEWGWEQGWELRLAFLRGRASLEDLSLRFPAHREGAAAAYLLSYTAVEQLLRLGGEIGLRSVFLQLAAGRSFDEALRRTYGLTADQFEARWRRAVAGRYGTLFVLSRAAIFWIAVTLLVLWVGGRRRRRDRAKLERMRREELESAAAGLPLEILDPGHAEKGDGR